MLIDSDIIDENPDTVHLKAAQPQATGNVVGSKEWKRELYDWYVSLPFVHDEDNPNCGMCRQCIDGTLGILDIVTREKEGTLGQGEMYRHAHQTMTSQILELTEDVPRERFAELVHAVENMERIPQSIGEPGEAKIRREIAEMRVLETAKALVP